MSSFTMLWFLFSPRTPVGWMARTRRLVLGHSDARPRSNAHPFPTLYCVFVQWWDPRTNGFGCLVFPGFSLELNGAWIVRSLCCAFSCSFDLQIEAFAQGTFFLLSSPWSKRDCIKSGLPPHVCSLYEWKELTLWSWAYHLFANLRNNYRVRGSMPL